MINIRHHLSSNVDDVDSLIDSAISELWNFLNPKKKDGKFRSTALINKVSKLKNLISSEQYKKDNLHSYKRHQSLLKYLDDESILFKIISSQPKEFDSITNDILNHVREGDLFFKKGNSFHKTEFGELLLNKVFDYDSYRSSNTLTQIYTSLYFQEATCVYCNSDSAIIIENDDNLGSDNQALFELDHFYPKSKYPYLALSFYNHIPTCSNCNGKLKRSRDFTLTTHIQPYHRCFDDIYHFTSVDDLIMGDKLSKIELKNVSNRSDSLVKDLKLESRYNKLLNISNSHKLLDLLFKYRHILLNSNAVNESKELLIDNLLSHAPQTKNEILQVQYGKLKRDLIRIFDVNNLFLKD